jgi:transcriptional regulator with XRE-family HTH domain
MGMNEALNFAKRLSELMQNAGFQPRPSVLEREFNLRYWGRSVTLQGVRRWLRGEAIPADDKLECLAEWLGVDKYYLRFGEQAAIALRKKVSLEQYALTPNEKKLFETYIKLNPRQKKLIEELIREFANHSV